MNAAAVVTAAAVSFQALPKTAIPESGPLDPAILARLTLTDAERAGKRIVAVGDRGFIVYSDDDGRTWSRANAPAAPLLTALRFADEKQGLAVGHDAVILATSDGGESWTQVFSAAKDERPLLDVIFLDKSNAIAVGAYGAYYESADGGKTWAARKVEAGDKHLNGIVRVDASTLLIVGEAGTMLLSTDTGKTWSSVPSPYKGSLFGAVVAADGAVVAYGLRGRIYRSTDKARTWKQVDNASTPSIMGGARLPDGTLVLAGAAGVALVSRDNGQSFVPLATGTIRGFANAVAGGRDEVHLIGEAGVRTLALPAAR